MLPSELAVTGAFRKAPQGDVNDGIQSFLPAPDRASTVPGIGHNVNVTARQRRHASGGRGRLERAFEGVRLEHDVAAHHVAK